MPICINWSSEGHLGLEEPIKLLKKRYTPTSNIAKKDYLFHL